MKTWLCTVALIGFTTPALAAAKGVFIGTVGTLPVVMQLGDYDAYYYRNHARDIQLNRTENGSRLELAEQAFYGADSSAKLVLQKSGAGWSGQWVNIKKNTQLPVSLRPVNSGDLNAVKLPATALLSQWKRNNPYDYLRFTGSFKSLKTTRLNNKRLDWWLEPKSRVQFLRLPTQNKAVNDALLDEHYRLASQALQCPIDGPDGFSYESTVSLYSQRLLSIKGTAYYDCGGAHPDSAAENLTLDLKSGKALLLEDLYRFIKVPAGVNLAEEEADELHMAYLEKRGAVIRSLIFKQFKTFTKNLDAVCETEYQQTDPFQFLNWYLSAKGLVVQPWFPHVTVACEDDFELPYQSLKNYLAPNSPLR